MMASGGDVMGGDGGLALIQKALGDERARSDQHKQNYEHLKSQLSQVMCHTGKKLFFVKKFLIRTAPC